MCIYIYIYIYIYYTSYIYIYICVWGCTSPGAEISGIHI